MKHWDEEESKKELLRMFCTHVQKKSIPPLPDQYPDLICKKCIKLLDDESVPMEKKLNDIHLSCPDCMSKSIRDKSWWNDWYKSALEFYQHLGYKSIPCMDDADLKVVRPLLEGCECGVCKGDINSVEDPFKSNEDGSFIKQYFHCKTCLVKKPKDKSASEWARINVGFTARGLEVWCARCEKSIINLDFNGNSPTIIKSFK